MVFFLLNIHLKLTSMSSAQRVGFRGIFKSAFVFPFSSFRLAHMGNVSFVVVSDVSQLDCSV